MGPAQMMENPKEVKNLGFLLGKWKSKGTMMGDDGKPQPTTGSADGAMTLGDRWVRFSTSEKMGQWGDVMGSLMVTYEPLKKKYVGVWFDSMSNNYLTMSGDLSNGKLVMTSDPYDMGEMGKMTFRITYIIKSAKEVQFKLEMDAGGSFAPVLDTTYTK